ncbi:MAG: mechanosensitive ion channel [Saprospiraceae bacterium]|nr:mechanosensitive ion channel [Bacteroidia bacterium]NNE16012.1 mechanosensitive ion channel [Saprospiraceae bacterium]NNL90712.1 mechanosensitive ion channel [Saprospiraceae bacterium]
MDSEKLNEYMNAVMDWAVVFVPKAILAGFVLYIGFYIVKKVSLAISKGLDKAKLGVEVSEFLGSIIDIIMKIIVIAISASIIGIELSALFGILAAAGFAIGLALQGFLGNFASGLTILFFKPYRVGDWVSITERFGRVESIQIFNTTLTTPNDKTLVIPNGQVTDNIITNYSTKGKLRLELNVTMGYAESFPRVKKIIEDALKNCETILHDPSPLIGIENYDSHNIMLAIRPYILPDNFWDATFEVYSKIKEAFSANGIMAAYSEGVELGPIGN